MSADDLSKTDLKGAFQLLNRDFQVFHQRVTEWSTDHDRRLTRGGERFARIDLQMQAIEAAINGLRTDHSRAMAAAERAAALAQDNDRTVGATLRLANKVQQEGAALQGELRGDMVVLHANISAIRVGFDRLTAIVYGAGALIGAIELARFVQMMRRKTNA